MKYCALASGSNGNCYYLANGEDAVLIDVGINAKQVELRMTNLGIVPSTIKAIFITHEHTDHIRGLAVFCKRYQVPVYMTAGSYHGSRLQLPEYLLHIINSDQMVKIGALMICGVPKYHDAEDPCSFVVSNGEVNVAVLTDIGRVCDNVKRVVSEADVLLLEANYDEELLNSGSYPYFLKNRIQDGWGHLANHTALQTVLTYRKRRLRHLILGHLSGQNNSVELVYKTFAPHFGGTKLSIATRFQETELFDSGGLLPILAEKPSLQQVSLQTSLVFPSM